MMLKKISLKKFILIALVLITVLFPACQNRQIEELNNLVEEYEAQISSIENSALDDKNEMQSVINDLESDINDYKEDESELLKANSKLQTDIEKKNADILSLEADIEKLNGVIRQYEDIITQPVNKNNFSLLHVFDAREGYISFNARNIDYYVYQTIVISEERSNVDIPNEDIHISSEVSGSYFVLSAVGTIYNFKLLSFSRNFRNSGISKYSPNS